MRGDVDGPDGRVIRLRPLAAPVDRHAAGHRLPLTLGEQQVVVHLHDWPAGGRHVVHGAAIYGAELHLAIPQGLHLGRAGQRAVLILLRDEDVEHIGDLLPERCGVRLDDRAVDEPHVGQDVLGERRLGDVNTDVLQLLRREETVVADDLVLTAQAGLALADVLDLVQLALVTALLVVPALRVAQVGGDLGADEVLVGDQLREGVLGHHLADEETLLILPLLRGEVGVDVPGLERLVVGTLDRRGDGGEHACRVRLPLSGTGRVDQRPLGHAEAVDAAPAHHLLAELGVVQLGVGQLVLHLQCHALGALFGEGLDRLLDHLGGDRHRLFENRLLLLQGRDDVLQVLDGDVGEGGRLQVPVLLLGREHHLHHLGDPAHEFCVGVLGVDPGAPLGDLDLGVVDRLVLAQVLQPLDLQLAALRLEGLEPAPEPDA